MYQGLPLSSSFLSLHASLFCKDEPRVLRPSPTPPVRALPLICHRHFRFASFDFRSSDSNVIPQKDSLPGVPPHRAPSLLNWFVLTQYKSRLSTHLRVSCFSCISSLSSGMVFISVCKCADAFFLFPSLQIL